MINAGTLSPEKLVGNTIRLDDAPEALVRMDDHLGIGVTVINEF
jgi:alcohol dehydrogenase